MDCLLHKLEDMRLALGSDRVYDVSGAIIPAPLIQDPASKLWPREEVSVVRYVVGQQDRKRASTAPESSGGRQDGADDD